MNGAAPYAITGLACGVIFALLLLIAVVKAGREADEQSRWEALRVRADRLLPVTEEMVPVPPTLSENAEVLAAAESFCREAIL